MDKNYSFLLNADLHEYRGKWIALIDGAVVACGTNAKAVYTKAKKKFPTKEPFLDKVQGDNVLIV